jgi:hypothetical protein
MAGKESGGKFPVNLNQGFRAESLAQYILSEFGPCIRVTKENDYGLDLICSLMDVKGPVGYVKEVFGIQVKSGKEPFRYNGVHLLTWLTNLNIPLFFARVNRKKASLKLYCSWTLTFILQWETKGFVKNNLLFLPEDNLNTELKHPEETENETIIHLGKPIIELDTMQLSDKTFRDKIFKILDEWVSFEYQNYAYRIAGIPVSFGYKTWTTNESLDTSFREWYQPYFFGGVCFDKAKEAFIKSATVMGLSWQESDKDAFQNLKEYFENSHLNPNNFTKSIFKLG